jgi:hypothetical protein
MINSSGLPILVGQYEMPTEKLGGGFFSTWPAAIAALTPAWVSGPCPTCVPPGGLPRYFTNALGSDGRPVWLTPGLAMLVDRNAAGAAAAWSWWKTNVYSKVPDFSKDPKWAIVPRTDNKTLPPQSTAMP